MKRSEGIKLLSSLIRDHIDCDEETYDELIIDPIRVGIILDEMVRAGFRPPPMTNLLAWKDDPSIETIAEVLYQFQWEVE